MVKLNKSLGKLAVVLSLLAAAVVGCSSNAEPPQVHGAILPEAKRIAPFVLKQASGTPFSEQSLRGHWTVAFFGFTSCPAICPNTLGMMNQVWQALEQEQQLGDTQFVFVSVDPKRDGLERLNDYVHRFNPQFVGVTGAHSQLHAFASQVGVPYAVEESADNNYFVDHGTMLVVINPQGQFQAALTAPHNKEQLVHDIKALKTYFS